MSFVRWMFEVDFTAADCCCTGASSLSHPSSVGAASQLVQAAGVAKYEFDIKAPERMTMSLNDRITRLIKDKANYPGFRPGTVSRAV